MDDLITQKIEELTELAKASGEKYTASILLSLNGARMSGDDNILSAVVAECVENVLIPLVEARKESDNASKN